MKDLIKSHLQLVFNNTSGYSSILAIKNGMKSICIPFSVTEITDELVNNIINLNNNGYNIYFTPNLQNNKPVNGKGTEEDISLQTCMVVDIDIEGCDKHKSIGDKKYTPDIQTAISLLPLTPSFIVETGYGIQAYYLLKQPSIPNSNSKPIHRSYIKFIRKKAKELGITDGIDYVQSLEHTFRLAGTKNFKKVNNSIPVNPPVSSIINRTNLKYSQESFLEYANFSIISSKSQAVSNENIEWATYFLLRVPAKSLNYEQWRNVVWICTSLGLTSEVDEWSKKDTERYNGIKSLVKSYKDTGLTIATLISYLPNNDYFKLGNSSMDNAIRFINMYKDYFYFVKSTNSWLIYDFKSHIWNLSKEIFPASLCQLITDCYKQLSVIAPKTSSILRLLKSWEEPTTIEKAIKYLKYMSIIKIDNMPQPPKYLLNVNNGVINLKTGELLPHNPKYFFTQIINIDYNPNAESDIVNNFFESILPDIDTRKALIRFLGYCLTGETKEQKALFIFGKGSNGKSVLFNTLKLLLQSFYTSLPSTALQIKGSKNMSKDITELNNIYNKRLSIIDEIPFNYKLDVNTFKKITGGDALILRFLYKEPIEIQNISKLILSGNNTPEFYDSNDDSIPRRILLIHLTQTFIGESQDVNIATKLSNNLPAFLNLLVKESILYYKEGLLESDTMKHDKELYLDQLDFIQEYIVTYCNLDKNNCVKRKDLLASIRNAYPEYTKYLSDKTIITLILNNTTDIEIYNLHGYLTFRGIALK